MLTLALRTQIFSQLPWIGGVNTSIDSAMIPANQLVQADHVQFDTRGSRQKRDGINYNWDSVSTGSTSALLGGFDFWYGATSKTQRLVSVDDTKNIYAYTPGGTTGTRTTLGISATAWSSTITKVSFESINNLCLIAVDGTSNLVRKWAGGSNPVQDLGGTPPQASILRTHLGRLWTNDKTNRDRLQYSPVADPETWGGNGDSGAIDIGVGDGDPEGITAIFPSFKGVLFVAKRTKLYKISGLNPEDFAIELISNGIGCVSHNAVATIDQDDIYFISDRGVHSLAATVNYGDFESTFISEDIQRTFRDEWNASNRQFIQCGYIPSLNSAQFAVIDNSVDSTKQSTIWNYNIPLKAWYRWPSVPCSTYFVANDTDQKRAYVGGSTGRLAQTLTDKVYDITSSGSFAAILYTIKTGLIFPDANPYFTKAFKKFSLVYKPQGSHTITMTVKIDNFASQSWTYVQDNSLALLGSTFVLGTSMLGGDFTMAPYTQPIDGYGRGIQITIQEAGVNEYVEIQGFLIEYESAGTQQEVRTTA